MNTITINSDNNNDNNYNMNINEIIKIIIVKMIILMLIIIIIIKIILYKKYMRNDIKNLGPELPLPITKEKVYAYKTFIPSANQVFI